LTGLANPRERSAGPLPDQDAKHKEKSVKVKKTAFYNWAAWIFRINTVLIGI